MLLTDLISLSPDFSSLSEADKISYLQKAYYIVVDNIRLDVGLYPLLMKNEFFSIDKFAYKAIRVGEGSEIAFKETKNFTRCDFSQDGTVEINTNKVIVGYPEKEFFGFDEADYDAMNAEHETIPYLFQSKQHYHLLNKDDIDYGFCHMIGYQYPYPVLVSDDSFSTEYRYDISWMSTTYGFSNLEIDEFLGILMLLKGLQLYHEENLSINISKNFDYMCTTFTNYYNENKESIRNNRLTTLALMGL